MQILDLYNLEQLCHDLLITEKILRSETRTEQQVE